MIADRILARCAPVEPIEPTSDVGLDDFGTINGQQTIAELKDLLANWDPRMTDLQNAYNKIASQWAGSDAVSYAQWTSDFTALRGRYSQAQSSARTTIDLAAINPAPNSTIPAQSAFDGVMKALKQGYPPDGAATRPGDYDDLYSRLQNAYRSVGAPAFSVTTVQPTAADVDLNALNILAPVDVIAPLVGDMHAPASGSSLSALKWLYDHREALIIGGALVAGGIVLVQLLPALALPAKLAKVAALAA